MFVLLGPSGTVSSAYASFTFNSTASAVDTWYQYSLDGSSWAGCTDSLRVGPVSAGQHVLQVRTVNDNGTLVSDGVDFHWSVVAASDSLLSFTGITGKASEYGSMRQWGIERARVRK